MCFHRLQQKDGFDCCSTTHWCGTLRRMGFPEHIELTCLTGYTKDRLPVIRTEFGDTELFPIGKGVRSGCILSPMLLFNLYAGEIMRCDAGLQESQSGSQNWWESTTNNLRYAYDTTLMAGTRCWSWKTLSIAVKDSCKKEWSHTEHKEN